ncbi:small nuclear ribonucleoprotein (LSM7), putative [Aspergillus fumigatus A1163]|uniref:Small nuclear ribonucleoprotein (LSM7), putative n=3 Tax=Aspergillus fumigatus TaxID=746128 RepID=E9QQJ2_ASPFU|nr:small nuclear ribonucleoprotein (LSM7), putative [Aspergillus fumigatus Af293]EAL90761.1 small nuclear ribonucleoprotein (LSM7), putative [Aspergillus fumigatus Af293]EDP56666.1 small nuclear ribonucleoprotein (LSM7), putative [Aspergillus fumigatus A1163]CAF32144.1 u6 snrna-associated sm-like protein, putative [Aspergillus fumigatus]
MSERGSFRGGRSRGGGHDRSGGRGGGHSSQHRGGGAGGGAQQQQEKPKKENILDLSKYMDKEVKVKFNGGREVSGMLKGYDQLMNLVLDDVKESMRGKSLNDITKLDEVSNSAIQMMKEMKLPAPLVSSSPAAL